jgi:regulator of sirC expression with transglutaminase-like and TPR domain
MIDQIDQIAHLGLVDESEIELDRAALEIAALDHPEAALEPYLALLDDMTERLHVRAALARGAGSQGDALAEVLGVEFGFEGDAETYDDPANADLIRVIDRRRGLPIALSILYVALARRVGWTAHALNTPRHVLVGIGRPGSLLVDPFNRGAFVGREQLASLLHAAPDRVGAAAAAQVAPMSNRAVLVRLMMNQATRAEHAGELARPERRLVGSRQARAEPGRPGRRPPQPQRDAGDDPRPAAARRGGAGAGRPGQRLKAARLTPGRRCHRRARAQQLLPRRQATTKGHNEREEPPWA